MKKICVVTGTRAEYGLLKPLIRRINDDLELELQLIVTGMHLSSEFGLTYKEIINDGFIITEKVEMLLSSDTPIGISKSMGLAMISFSEVFERIKPDMLIVLGDRYEIFSVASVAMNARIPIAHLHGGEKTEGLIDEAIRHSITKMSYLHFTSSEVYRNRVIQLGEHPSRVFNVGAIVQDSIKTIELMTKENLEKNLGIKFDKRTALLTFHPTTLEDYSSKEQFENILAALEEFEELKIIFTKANSDADGRIINNMIDEYVSKNTHKCVAFSSLGQLRYLSAMKYCDFVIGNSSSGIIEAPILKKPTVNIGNRQRGRSREKSVLDCNPVKSEIIKAIEMVLSEEFKNVLDRLNDNYNDIPVAEKIVLTIKKFFSNNEINIIKEFYDIKVR